MDEVKKTGHKLDKTNNKQDNAYVHFGLQQRESNNYRVNA